MLHLDRTTQRYLSLSLSLLCLSPLHMTRGAAESGGVIASWRDRNVALTARIRVRRLYSDDSRMGLGAGFASEPACLASASAAIANAASATTNATTVAPTTST